MNIQTVTIVAVLPNGKTAIDNRQLDIDDLDTLQWVANQLYEVNNNAHITIRYNGKILVIIEGK